MIQINLGGFLMKSLMVAGLIVGLPLLAVAWVAGMAFFIAVVIIVTVVGAPFELLTEIVESIPEYRSPKKHRRITRNINRLLRRHKFVSLTIDDSFMGHILKSLGVPTIDVPSNFPLDKDMLSERVCIVQMADDIVRIISPNPTPRTTAEIDLTDPNSLLELQRILYSKMPFRQNLS